MTTLLWFYLGGVVGQAMIIASNEDVSRGLKRAVHDGGWRAMGGYLIGLALWPLTSAVVLIFGPAIIRHIDERT